MQARRYEWRAVSLGLAIGLAALAAASSAGAATQIGETFTPMAPQPPCGPGTWLQSGSPNGQYAAPFAGVISSWSYQATASPQGQLKLKVVRLIGTNTFLVVGESELQTPLPNTLNR